MSREIYIIKRLSLNFVAVHRVQKNALNIFINEKSKLHFRPQNSGIILHTTKEGL